MGLTREYLRYVSAGNFNIIASPRCNVKFVTLEGQEGRFVAVGACENIIIWDLRRGEQAQVLPGEKAVVTAICASPNKKHLAAGYSDGTVQVYDLKTAEVIQIFSGHRSEITTLAYDVYGHNLASGSKDTDVIIWDVVAETGLCRLSGHQGQITQIMFMSQQPIIITSSKDSFVKFWDIKTRYCFKTLFGHKNEVWGLALLKDDQYLVAGCGAELQVWKLSQRDPDSDKNNPVDHLTKTLELVDIDDADDPRHPLQCLKVGCLLRQGKGRVVSMFSDESGQIIGCHGTDAQVELYYFCTDDEAKVRLKKRIKKIEKMKRTEKMEVDQVEQVVQSESFLELSLSDEVKRLPVIKVPNKPKSIDLVLGNGGELRVAVTLANNIIELYTVQTIKKHVEPKLLRSVANQGHHSEVRALCFSSDELVVASGSAEAIKLWNRPTQTNLRTIETGYVLSMVFAPGDRHILAGLNNGTLLIIDISAGYILEEIPAHATELWSICLLPDLSGVVTGGGDKTVKFWTFELVVDEKSESKAKVLSLIHTRTLKVDDNVLCVKVSPNGKFVAAALLDSTVKIFFVDTFKFYLSLYGHKLPVLCMDISSDSSLIATGSADRNVKIWGMGFGDCHKSIFAHDDSVTGLQFVPRSHYFFTCGKDGKVKEWDGKTFDKIITLHGHAGEAWTLAVSPHGKFVVSSGSDRVLRLYEKSDQPLVLEDEQEEERAEQEALATGEQTVIPGQSSLNLPSKKTIGSERGADNILECLEVCKTYKEQLAEHTALQATSKQTLPLPQPPLLMLAFNVSTPEDFLLETFKRIRASDLYESLSLLPFTSVCEVLQILPALARRLDNIELICKITLFLSKSYQAQLVANQALLPTLRELRELLFPNLQKAKDSVGYNLYALKYLQRQIEEAEGIQLFRDATLEKKKGEKKRKQREKLKRSILVLS